MFVNSMYSSRGSPSPSMNHRERFLPHDARAAAIWCMNTLSRNEERCARACEIGLRVTLAVKGDGRPASVLPRSSRPSGNVRESRAHVRAPALAKQIATNFNCLCIHLLTPNALQPHPPILLSSPAQMKEREAGDGAREEAGIITYFSGPL